MAQGSIITEAQNERICEALWGFYDPITGPEGNDNAGYECRGRGLPGC